MCVCFCGQKIRPYGVIVTCTKKIKKFFAPISPFLSTEVGYKNVTQKSLSRPKAQYFTVCLIIYKPKTPLCSVCLFFCLPSSIKLLADSNKSPYPSTTFSFWTDNAQITTTKPSFFSNLIYQTATDPDPDINTDR